jgi:hypothetical protein
LKDREARCYLVVVRIGRRNPDPKRVLATLADVKESLQRCSVGDVELAFNSRDVETTGLLLKSTYHPKGIVSVLRGSGLSGDSSGYGATRSASLLNDDDVVVFEVGGDVGSHGFSKVQMWIEQNAGIPRSSTR